MAPSTGSGGAIFDSLLFVVCAAGSSRLYKLTHDQGPLIGRLLETHPSHPISGCLHVPLHTQRCSWFLSLAFGL